MIVFETQFAIIRPIAAILTAGRPKDMGMCMASD